MFRGSGLGGAERAEQVLPHHEQPLIRRAQARGAEREFEWCSGTTALPLRQIKALERAPRGEILRSGSRWSCAYRATISPLMARRLPFVPSFLVLVLTSCSVQDRSISEKIKSQVQASPTAPLDLTFVGPKGWERVCIFGPYTTNELVESDLGFKWDADSESSISVNDGINLIVFTRGKKVIAFAEHKRADGDFESEKSRCTSRAAPRLARSIRSDGVPLFAMPQ